MKQYGQSPIYFFIPLPPLDSGLPLFWTKWNLSLPASRIHSWNISCKVEGEKRQRCLEISDSTRVSICRMQIWGLLWSWLLCFESVRTLINFVFMSGFSKCSSSSSSSSCCCCCCCCCCCRPCCSCCWCCCCCCCSVCCAWCCFVCVCMCAFVCCLCSFCNVVLCALCVVCGLWFEVCGDSVVVVICCVCLLAFSLLLLLLRG